MTSKSDTPSGTYKQLYQTLHVMLLLNNNFTLREKRAKCLWKIYSKDNFYFDYFLHFRAVVKTSMNGHICIYAVSKTQPQFVCFNMALRSFAHFWHFPQFKKILKIHPEPHAY